MGDELDRLVERSRQLGADPSLVVHGGGNTSTKLDEEDWRGRTCRVLRVKGSGTDLATIDRAGFPGLYMDELEVLRREREAMSDEEMTAYLAHCMTEPGGRPPSIETLLHAWLPATHVDHTHADAICALTNHPGGYAAVVEALGDDIAFVPYIRPGFELSRQVAELAEARAVVLSHHGLVTWGESHEESFALTRELADRADEYLRERSESVETSVLPLAELETVRLLAALREALSVRGPVVLHVDPGQRPIADRPDVERIAEFRGTPDHILRIGPRSLVVRESGEVAAAVASYASSYAAYFDRNAGRLDPGTGMLAPEPRVFLVPGLGCVAAGLSPRQARMNAELAAHSHAVSARAADAFGEVAWLDEEEVFDFDYWPMELRKLKLAPPPPELAGRVVGLALGVGPRRDAIVARLRAAGAMVLAGEQPLDLGRDAVLATGGIDAIVVDATRSDGMDAAPTAGTAPRLIVIDDGPGAAVAPGVSSVKVTAEAPEDAVAACVEVLVSPTAAPGSSLRAGR